MIYVTRKQRHDLELVIDDIIERIGCNYPSVDEHLDKEQYKARELLNSKVIEVQEVYVKTL